MIRTIAGLALASVVAAGPLATAASAGQLAGCCICQGCVTPPATQCFEDPAQGCETQCSVLNCAGFTDTQISCGQQPLCPTFSAPAPAPALAPAAAALAALAMAVVALRRLR
jgi:hypothetical protein